MSINPVLTTHRSGPFLKTLSRRLQVLTALAGFAATVASPWAQADNVNQVTRQHIENWNKTLETGNIGDILDLYADQQPMLLQPDGKVATTDGAIALFWRTLLSKGDSKFRFVLLAAHRQADMIVAHLALSHTGLQHIVFADGHDGMTIDCVLTQQTSGQWKTRIQKWG